MCPIHEAENTEIHIGDKKTFVLGEYFTCECLSTVGDTDLVLIYKFGRIESEQTQVILEFGPVSPSDADDEVLAPAEYRNENISFVRFRRVYFPRNLLER